MYRPAGSLELLQNLGKSVFWGQQEESGLRGFKPLPFVLRNFNVTRKQRIEILVINIQFEDTQYSKVV